jgi:hypothetical protein
MNSGRLIILSAVITLLTVGFGAGFGVAAGLASSDTASSDTASSDTASSDTASSDTASSDTDDPAQAAAGWLARQLVDGERFETEFDGVIYPDQGLTADAVLAFDAANVAQNFADRATGWLAKPDILNGYLGYTFELSFAGPHAKLALVAIAQGLDPRAFGGVDLIDGLQELQDPSSGRYSDDFGDSDDDFSNAITQSLAIISLIRAEEDVAAGAAYLVGSQCDDGGFPLNFEQPTCTSEPDATGFAVQALLAAGLDDDANAALDYLENVQREGGGFGGAGPTAPTNANSTALAAQALRAGDRDDAADAAVEYLTSLQVGCDGPAEQHGAIAYDGTGFQTSTAIRATAQAVPALSGTGLVDVDNAGDSAPAPVLACPPAPSSTTSTPSESTTSTTTTSPAPQAGAAPELPATGPPTRPLLWTGALLVLAGTGLVLIARLRRSRPDAER